MILNTSWSKYMEQSSKVRFVQGLHNPTHGNRAIYFYPGVAFLATIESSSPGGSANGLDMYIVEDSGEVETVTVNSHHLWSIVSFGGRAEIFV